ncbi:MAG: glycosyltransferase family 2 protein [bacterium]|nr:glycosyltransferase family 2 protein [bacterium]
MNGLSLILLFIGLNYGFWAIIGLIRFLSERYRTEVAGELPPKQNVPFTWGQFWRRAFYIEAFIPALGISALALLVVIFGVLGDNLVGEIVSLSGENIIYGILPLWAALGAIFGYATVRLHRFRGFKFIFADLILLTIAAGFFWLFTMITLEAWLPLAYRKFISFAAADRWVFYSLGAGLIYLGGIEAALVETVSPFFYRPKTLPVATRIPRERIAALIAAHNEELTIGDTLRSLCAILPASNIYVGNDGSTDATSAIVRSHGINVLDISPNQGKAKALVGTLNHWQLLDRYDAILFLDADSRVDKNFLKEAVPLLDDERFVAVAGHEKSQWFDHLFPRRAMYPTAYRIKLWRLLQYGIKFGQTSTLLNATPIAPGGSSLYRTSALKHIRIDEPGLLIEDFNMTFQVYHKKLGKIAFTPRAFILDQEPYTLRDYAKQVKRWYVGYWQTFFRHGAWPSWFWFANFVFTLEMFLYALAIVLWLPLAILIFAARGFEPFFLPYLGEISFTGLAVGIFLADYLMTVFVALIERKPMLLVYGLGFFVIRYIDAAIYLTSIPGSIYLQSEGMWKSPARHLPITSGRVLPKVSSPRPQAATGPHPVPQVSK